MDCKVPVMFTYLGIIIIFSTFGHAYAETTVFNIDSVIKNQLTKCGNDIIVREGDTMKLTFQSPSRYVNLAFCWNESTENLNAKLNISNGQTITFDIVGSEEYEGLWNCSFLTHIGHYVRDSVTYDGGYYAPYANCSLMVRIQRDVTLTVSSTTTTNLVAAKATDIGYYRFIEGNKITFECKKGHTNGEFWQTGYLVLKFCWKDQSCANLKTKSTLVRDTMELNSTFDGSILRCIYNNSVGYQTDAAILLQIKAQSRPEIIVEGLAIREPRSSESKHTFDGTVNQTLELVCTNKENWGNIHWEFCDGSGLNCKSQTLAADKTLKINFTLSADNKNTTVKCVHTFNALREETPVFLYANEPPVLTTKNDMILNYNRGTDTYVIEREDEETIRIKCKSRENSGSLSWRDCNNAAQKSCTKTQDIYNRSIEKVIPWNSEKNEVFFYCVYKNSRNYEVSSKVNIVVHPSMSTRCKSSTILNIKNDGDEASGFTNGQTLCFSCYDTNINAEKCIIKLITAGQDDVEVPVVKENEKINNRNIYSGCLEMNFTSTDVEVKCLIFRNASDEKPSRSNFLRLTRKNLDFEPEGNPDLSNTILGQSSTIFKIKKNGDEASGFTNGQTLCFSCYDTIIDAEKCIIKLITAGQDDVEVPVKQNGKINNQNSYSGCLEMNFTSTDVEVKCLIFRKANDERPSTSNLLRLTRKNPDFEPEGNPDLNNTILGTYPTYSYF
ncbi:uncharacterized protein LOC135085670 isoform X1 [Ostrinia nubilalis]|uniref:uncharacterized protein LOC135085670 isoform X1 n=1 Tax=Ostrinia nubilalis TaxID=29057 RepID=UPI00308264EE